MRRRKVSKSIPSDWYDRETARFWLTQQDYSRDQAYRGGADEARRRDYGPPATSLTGRERLLDLFENYSTV